MEQDFHAFIICFLSPLFMCTEWTCNGFNYASKATLVFQYIIVYHIARIVISQNFLSEFQKIWTENARRVQVLTSEMSEQGIRQLIDLIRHPKTCIVTHKSHMKLVMASIKAVVSGATFQKTDGLQEEEKEDELLMMMHILMQYLLIYMERRKSIQSLFCFLKTKYKVYNSPYNNSLIEVEETCFRTTLFTLSCYYSFFFSSFSLISNQTITKLYCTTNNSPKSKKDGHKIGKSTLLICL